MLDKVKKGKMALAHRARSMELCQASSGKWVPWERLWRQAQSWEWEQREAAAGAELHTRGHVRMWEGDRGNQPWPWLRDDVSILGQDPTFPTFTQLVP